MFLENVGIVLSAFSFTCAFMVTFMLLSSLKFLVGFNDAVTVNAKIVDLSFEYEDEYEDPQDVRLTVEYHNALLNKDVKTELNDVISYKYVEMDCLHVGDEIKIQHTDKKARSFDERFSENIKIKYDIKSYIIAIAICTLLGVIGVIAIVS